MTRMRKILGDYKPAVILAAVMLASWAVYAVAWRIPINAVQQSLAFIFGAVLFLSVGFGVFIVYPLMYLKGAGAGTRVAASFITPLLWMIKESALLYITYSAAECLYYTINPLNVAITLTIAGQTGLSEAVMRFITDKENRGVLKLAAPLALFLLGFGSAIGLLMWGQGENAYVLFLENYRRIFGSGL